VANIGCGGLLRGFCVGFGRDIRLGDLAAGVQVAVVSHETCRANNLKCFQNVRGQYSCEIWVLVFGVLDCRLLNFLGIE